MKNPASYQPPEFKNEIRLQLSRNESQSPIEGLDEELRSLGAKFVSRYPSHQQLQDLIGKFVGVESSRIVVTAGGDESIDRVMRHCLTPAKTKVLTHAPSFEMIDIYSKNYGGEVHAVEWLKDEFPTEQLIKQIDDSVALVVLTTPNNPTGGVISLADIQLINESAKKAGVRVLVDNAYIEFADEDPTDDLVQDPNIMVVRTFSKAWGLAGLRVGYLIAPNPEFATMIRNMSGPFPVSAVSLELARRSLADHVDDMRALTDRIKKMRSAVTNLVESCGGTPQHSQGNFVLAEFENVDNVWNGLAEDGIGIRKFVGNPLLEGRLRITCPTNATDFLMVAKSLCRVSGTDFESQKVAFGVQFSDGSTAPKAKPNELKNGENPNRVFEMKRETKETNIQLSLNLDGTGQTKIETGIGFLDHMLTALAFHSGMDLSLQCQGDLHVDDHHTAEDCALALGTAIDQALGPRKGIVRFGYAYAPLDEALARTVVDLSGRPWPEVHLQLEREMVGTWACENVTHFFQSLAMTLKCSLHVDVLRGSNDHHRVEAAFKSCAKALKQALSRTAGDVPSTKGVL